MPAVPTPLTGRANARVALRLACVGTLAGALIAMQSSGVASGATHHRGQSTSNASCVDTGLLPTRANSTRAEAATLCLVNVQRARHGRRSLRQNADLARSSARHSEDMVRHNYFDHVSPGGETPLARIRASAYLPRRTTYQLGENIALGTMQLATPAAIVASWMRSPDHRANILNPNFRDSGVGIVAQAPKRYSSGEGGATYTQQFGVIGAR
jgi:uncharacterized protein YkwD